MSTPRAVKSEIERIGLTPAVGWYVASAIFFLTGANMWLGGLMGVDELADTMMRVVASIGLIASPVWFYCARRNVAERWLHIPIFLGMMNIQTMAIVLGSQRGAIAVIFMSALVPPAYLHGLRFAAPHFVLGAGCVSYTLLASAEPFAGLRVPVAIATMLLLLLMLCLAHEALARVVSINRQLAEVDPLTGVANVRTLRARLHDEAERVERHGGEFALFAIDLDNFKEVNDRFGHGVGDRVLRDAAAAMAGCLDPADLLARRGGDEFSVVAPMTQGRDPQELAQRLATAVARVRKISCPGVLPSASVGFVMRTAGEEPGRLIERSDAALHAQKLLVHPERVDTAAQQLSRPLCAAPAVAKTAGDDPALCADRPAGSRRRSGDQRARIGAVGFLLAGSVGVAGALMGAEGMTSAFAIGVAAIELASAPICLWLERSRRVRRGVSIMFTVAIAAVTAQILASGQAGSAMLDLFMGPVVFFFYVSLSQPKWPSSLRPLVFAGCMGLFALLLLNSGYPFTSLRLVATVNVLAVAAGLFVLTDRRIRLYNARNDELARTDSLTGLANVRQLQIRLEEEIARCSLTGDRFTLFMIDLDDFKQVNDRISHAVGDLTLANVGKAIESCVRADELAARRGGDEFAIVTGPAHEHEIEALRDRVCASVSQSRRAVCGELVSTASVGYATWNPGETAAELIDRADSQLKQSKIAGRLRRHPGAGLQAVS